MNKSYKPEGSGNSLYTPSCKSISDLQEAMYSGRILEGRASVCTTQKDLIVDFGFCRGIIPHNEGALGIAEGTTRDIAIISKVNKPVCFKVTAIEQGPDGSPRPLLSRRAAQQECMDNYISRLVPGDVIDAAVTHLEGFGCFVDIGCGIPSLIPIDNISISRIEHPNNRFYPGQNIKAVVHSTQNGRITLSHKELLGTWEENAAEFSPGETVAGIIRSVESYGVFVELAPNLTGLAEPKAGVVPGQHASVYIKSLIPEKMKIKLIIIEAFNARYHPEQPRYFITKGHIDEFVYSPAASPKIIKTDFRYN
ncbi:MAG: S1 RNA-binding domain-containing protein [Oscillospiraceae bacterium]|nr:S1 RNA-binding domain-containing protein [Oscillospiraceae bacterium]